MGKIVGSYIWYMFLSVIIWNVQLLAQVQLTVQTHDGMPLKKAGVGVPFRLQCTVAYEGGQIQDPVLEGTRGVTAQRIGFSVSTVNGASTATYTYLVRAKSPGTYTIGPIRYIYKGKEHISDTVTVEVIKEQEVDVAKVNAKKKGDVIARLTTKKEKLYVGEPFVYTLRFYSVDPAVEVEQIIRPSSDVFAIDAQHDTRTGTEKIGGKEYRYVEFSWDIRPLHAGRHVLQAHRVNYMQQHDAQNMRSAFSMFFGPRYERNSVYSNAIELKVCPLPSYDEHVIGIGKVDSFKAHISPAHAKEGDAMVLSLSVEGVGNMDAMKLPELAGMPDALRFYFSKEYSEPSDRSDCMRKVCEYIVQGMHVGDWEIPSQQCAYFDTDRGVYVPLTTSALSVHIMSGAQVGPVDQHKPLSDMCMPDEEKTPNIVLAGAVGSAQHEHIMPWWLMILLGLSPLIYAFFYACYVRGCKQFVSRLFDTSKRAKIRALKERMYCAQQQKKADQLYQILVEYIAIRDNIPVGKVTHDYMKKLFVDDAWQQFLMKAQEYAFYVDSEHVENFFNEGLQWIERLEK